MVGFEAAFRGWGPWKQDLEYAARNPHHALVFAYTDAELNDGAVGIPTHVRGKRKNMHLPRMFRECSGHIPRSYQVVESSRLVGSAWEKPTVTILDRSETQAELTETGMGLFGSKTENQSGL
jgi:hypothetical protein